MIEVVNEFSEVIKSVCKNLLHFYTLTANSEKEVKKTISFTLSSNRIKSLGINLTKELKELYIGNFKTLMKVFEEDTLKKGKIFCAHRLEE